MFFHPDSYFSMKLTGICYALVRFLSKHPILGCASFILLAILVFLNPLVSYVDLFVDNISLVAISSSISLLLDPLFLYAPLINEDTKCLVLDNKLKIIALVFRSWGDLRYIFRIFEVLYCWKKGSISKNIQELASNMMSVLPIPQVRSRNLLGRRSTYQILTRSIQSIIAYLSFWKFYCVCSWQFSIFFQI